MTSVWDKGISGARRRLQAARIAFQQHSDDCALWDYESDNDCPECRAARDEVRKAKEAVQRAKERAS